eukprot:SAG11_NODE_8838_length_971_cov_1.502294_2_plen_247_part_01
MAAARSVDAGCSIDARSLLLPPHRDARPARILVILRGLPGSGKTTAAQALKKLETEHNAPAPRIHSIDDYFIADDDDDEAPMRYEYDAALEPEYNTCLQKAFKKTIDAATVKRGSDQPADRGDRKRSHSSSRQGTSLPFIIVDACHPTAESFEAYLAYSKDHTDYALYVLELPRDNVEECARRTTAAKRRSRADVLAMNDSWEEMPPRLFSQYNVRQIIMDPGLLGKPTVALPGTALSAAVPSTSSS